MSPSCHGTLFVSFTSRRSCLLPSCLLLQSSRSFDFSVCSLCLVVLQWYPTNMPITQLMVDIWHFLGRKVATLSRYPKRAASDSGSHDASSFTSGGDYFVEYEFVDDDLTAMENPHESIGVVNESVPSSDVSGQASTRNCEAERAAGSLNRQNAINTVASRGLRRCRSAGSDLYCKDRGLKHCWPYRESHSHEAQESAEDVSLLPFCSGRWQLRLSR